MTLVVGTDSFTSLAEADVYFAARNNLDWEALDPADKEAGLRYATAWLDSKFRWRGSIAATTQVLGWPRFGAVDDERRLIASDVIPDRVRQATAEIALLHQANPVNEPTGRETSREKVGPIEVEYMEGAAAKQTFDFVRLLLKGLSRGGANVVRTLRA